MVSPYIYYNRDRPLATRLRRDSSIGGSNPYIPTNETDDTGTPVPTPLESSRDPTSSDVDVEAQSIDAQLDDMRVNFAIACCVLGLVFFVVIGFPLLKGLFWGLVGFLEWLFGPSSGSEATAASATATAAAQAMKENVGVGAGVGKEFLEGWKEGFAKGAEMVRGGQ